MKKILFLFLVLPFVFACSDNENENEPDKTESLTIEINVGETYNLPSGLYSIQTEPDDFIAEIKTDGKIIGLHVGNSNAIAKSGNITYNCDIEINTNNTLYVDLKYLIDAKKSDILKIYGQPQSINKQTYTFGKKLFENRTLFAFDENDKVVFAAIVFNSSYLSQIKAHLSDRYMLVAIKDKSSLYIDSYDMNTFKFAAMLEINGNEVGVTYTKKENVSQ
jgi:hypothetical protein